MQPLSRPVCLRLSDVPAHDFESAKEGLFLLSEGEVDCSRPEQAWKCHNLQDMLEGLCIGQKAELRSGVRKANSRGGPGRSTHYFVTYWACQILR